MNIMKVSTNKKIPFKNLEKRQSKIFQQRPIDQVPNAHYNCRPQGLNLETRLIELWIDNLLAKQIESIAHSVLRVSAFNVREARESTTDIGKQDTDNANST